MKKFICFIFIFIIFTCALVTGTFGENSTSFSSLSPDNPVFELIHTELSGQDENIYHVLMTINTLLNNYETQLSYLPDTQSLSIREQIDLFYLILDSSIILTKNVDFLSNGLLQKPPVRDCDTGCLLFLIAGFEFNWPLLVYSGDHLEDTDKAGHSLLLVRTAGKKSVFYETTNGKWYSTLSKNPYYVHYNFISLSGEQLFGIFYEKKAAKHLMNNELENAIICFQKAIALQSIHLDKIYFNAGTAFVKNGEYENAIEAFEKSLELCPDAPDTLTNLRLTFCLWADFYFRNKNFIDAVRIYEEGLKRFPDSKIILNELLFTYKYLAYYYYVIKEYKKAVGIAGKAVEMSPIKEKKNYEVFYDDLIQLILAESE